MKSIKYFLQAIIIYLLFVIIKIIGLNLSRKLFAKFFQNIGRLIKSEKVLLISPYFFSPDGSRKYAACKTLFFLLEKSDQRKLLL